MKDDNFFDNTKTEESNVTEAPEKIKLGDEEYTQEDLEALVGLGKIGREAEEKFKTKIDRVWPNYQKVINEKQAMEEELTKLREAQNKPAETQSFNGQLTPEQIKAEAIKQAEELGIGPAAIRRTVMEVVQGQNLINDISQTIDNATSDGLPSTTVEDVIAHMQETGIRNPDKAYKDMFEKEWIQRETTKIESIRQKGMPTIEASHAGGKQPEAVRVTRDNLEQLVSEALAAGGNS